MTYVAPTDKMRRFLLALVAERSYPELGSCGEERLENVGAALENRALDKWQAMDLIDELKAAPRDVESTESDVALRPGVYRRNGVIYVVRSNRAQTSLYAKRLVEIGGRRLTEANTVVRVEFTYAPGAVTELRPRDMMTLEEAHPFIIRYGRCIFCNTPLRDARSVERGVGPVCLKRFAPPKSSPAEDPQAEARLAGLLAQLQERPYVPSPSPTGGTSALTKLLNRDES